MKNIVVLILIITGIVFTGEKSYGQYNASSGLNAVLIVGHQEDGTMDAIRKMNKTAGILEQYGVNVYKFYDKDANWTAIKNIAPYCSFLVYSGHGSTLGVDGNVGGLCLTSNISTATIINDLKLKHNALVIFKSVCNGSGSSAGDDYDIGISEAKKRVTHYAYPFFKSGAAAYYANNYVDGSDNFLVDFLTGMSLKNAFVKSTNLWTTIEIDESFSMDWNKKISIAGSEGGGIATRTTYTNGVKTVEKIVSPKDYSIAYVGRESFSISDMK
ncbi:MAG: hypothetical protein FGM46_02055 [Ferruginibacter sp.]|nr:hypothetical protein [Ferruginibacter sp.]